MGSQTEAASTGPAQVCTRSSVDMLWPLAPCFCKAPNSRSRGVSDSLPALRLFFFLLGCLVQLQYVGFCLDLLCFGLSRLVVITWRPILFQWGTEEEWMGRGGHEGAGRGGGRGNCGQDVLYERRIYLQFLKCAWDLNRVLNKK